MRTINALKVPMNVMDYNGRTPLHIAAAEGNYEVVTFLVASGLSVS